MAESLSDIFSGSFTTRLQWQRVDSQEVGSITDRQTVSGSYPLADGAAANAADIVWCDTRTIPAASFDALDLLTLTQSTVGVSVPCTIRQLRIVRVVNNSTTAGNEILVGSNEAGTLYAFKVGPGSEVAAVNQLESWPVNSANSVLRIANPNAAAVSYTIFLVGTSVAAGA
jgi:hypothetical protein